MCSSSSAWPRSASMPATCSCWSAAGRPGVARLLRQVHARKNHSYFLVFQKVPAGQDGRPLPHPRPASAPALPATLGGPALLALPPAGDPA